MLGMMGIQVRGGVAGVTVAMVMVRLCLFVIVVSKNTFLMIFGSLNPTLMEKKRIKRYTYL